MKPNNFFQANIPQFGATNNTGMSLFLGQTTQVANNKMNWAEADSTRGYMIYNGDTIKLFSDSVGFCNADRFLTNPNYQNFTINITGVTLPADSCIAAFALYDTYKGVWPMSHVNSGSITEGHVPNIPVHFVVYAAVNGYFYCGISAVTPSTGSTYTVTLTKMDPTAFKAQVDAL
jgi:hypothetical protein